MITAGSTAGGGFWWLAEVQVDCAARRAMDIYDESALALDIDRPLATTSTWWTSDESQNRPTECRLACSSPR